VSVVSDKANLLRARLHDDLAAHDVERGAGNPPYYLRNIKQQKITGITVTGHAQSVHCRFCGKQFGTLPQRARSQRGAKSWRHSSGTLWALLNLHLDACAYQWMRSVLCRWSTGQLTRDEHDHVVAWQKKHMASARTDDGPYERRERIPHELTGIFDNLPEPPGHPMPQALEVALVAISRMWVPESRP
jgi:hypothetical protein